MLAIVIVFGGLYLRQTYKASQAKAEAGALQQKAGELQSSLEVQQSQATQLRDQLKKTRADSEATINAAAEIRRKLQETRTNQTAGDLASNPANARPANPLAEMFKNPEMREMIKNQQKAALSGSVDKNYGKFFADAHLTPEQSSALKDMILNKQLGAADLGMSMLSGDLDAAQKADLVQQIKMQGEAADAKMKEFLGDDNFAQFQTYEKSMGERNAVSGFKDQLGSGPGALTGDQEEQLIQAMTQERQNFKFTTDLSDKSKFDGDFSSMLTEDKMNGFFQEQEKLNQQYLARALGILPPDQAAAFEKYLNSQQALQKAGMQMAAKMFAPAK
ncbi:MAG: hypothetical protein JWQ04_3166 [Pedosphaera sp.]|nr:hypothetical protein [Pedosphaera sp.]